MTLLVISTLKLNCVTETFSSKGNVATGLQYSSFSLRESERVELIPFYLRFILDRVVIYVFDPEKSQEDGDFLLN